MGTGQQGHKGWFKCKQCGDRINKNRRMLNVTTRDFSDRDYFTCSDCKIENLNSEEEK